ncbi:hypothetical protein CKAH01_07598 [Colletotrichum kahawae]|uniref:Uncharacterized protein n=1 Tax=Colletotrichum kahawae TaxID=34407 RepID=A0AAD9Y5K4_COLKA|nr:hypothetical protein CKAH01_07598 [Colletotrichum kahawae]
MFYQGLKDEVKDEIIKVDRPEDFLHLTSNWTFNEGEKITYRFTPSVDDTSSEEESNDEEETQQLVRYQTIDTNHNNQQQHFYSALANQRDRDYTLKLHTEDHPTLRSDH